MKDSRYYANRISRNGGGVAGWYRTTLDYDESLPFLFALGCAGLLAVARGR